MVTMISGACSKVQISGLSSIGEVHGYLYGLYDTHAIPRMQTQATPAPTHFPCCPLPLSRPNHQMLNPSETFGDIIVDYSYVECTSACITALCAFRASYPEHRSLDIQTALDKNKGGGSVRRVGQSIQSAPQDQRGMMNSYLLTEGPNDILGNSMSTAHTC